MNNWFRCRQPLPRPVARLVCLPHAGGGAGLFHRWPGRLAPMGIEVWAAQLPGREHRLREAPFHQLEPLVEQLAAHLPPDDSVPLVLFGHSMGALLAFELARTCRRSGRVEPALLFAAAASAPQFPLPTPHLHDLPRPEFLAGLDTRYSGIPATIADHAELMDLLLPMLRADLQLCETYAYRPEAPLACPLIMIGGLADDTLSRPKLNAWQRHTTGPFELHLLPGGHFFVQEQEEALLDLVAERLALHLSLPHVSPSSAQMPRFPGNTLASNG